RTGAVRPNPGGSGLCPDTGHPHPRRSRNLRPWAEPARRPSARRLMYLLLQSSRRFFRRHPGQLALALAGMAAGVAVMTGVALMRDVLVDSLDGAAVALSVRDSVRVTSPGGPLDETLYRRLALHDGAPPVTPVLQQRVALGE